jgi:hypothetical protein
MPLALSRRQPTNVDRFALPPIRETDLDRILKLIPTELLAFYTAAIPVISEVAWRFFPFVLFIAGIALIPVTLYLDGLSTHQCARWPQYLVRILCFAAWANAISWPFAPWASAHDVTWVRALCVLIIPLVGAFALRDKLPTAPPA